MMTVPHLFQKLSTPIGELTLVASQRGLRAVLWPTDEGRVPLPERLMPSTADPVLSSAARQLEQYFSRERTSFDLPLDLHGTEFQQSVWRSLQEIPYGQTWTYKKQAIQINRPKAVRAIGSANGKNPVSIVLPCHRVIGTNGSLTGFAGGLETKKQLLLLEEAIQTDDQV